MGTLGRLLAVARDQLGVKESPPNSNSVKYNDWYYGRHVEGKEYSWCMAFCQWVFNEAGIPLPAKAASCTAFMNAAKATKTFVNNRNMRPGDLVLYRFKSEPGTSDHCGIVVDVSGIKIKAIEGNTGTGNDTNGGMVMLRDRNISQCVGAFRPIFDWEEEIDMTKAEFIRTLTDKEAYDILQKAMKHANTLPQPAWSKQEGHWDKAIEKKIVGSKTPRGLLRRDEFVSIIGRLGLIDG